MAERESMVGFLKAEDTKRPRRFGSRELLVRKLSKLFAPGLQIGDNAMDGVKKGSEVHEMYPRLDAI